MAWRRSRQKVSSSSPSRPSVVRAAALHLSSLHAGRLQTGRLRPHLQSERKQLFKPRPVCRQFVVYSESFTQAGEIKQGAGHRRTPAHVKPSSAAQSSVTCGEFKTAYGLKKYSPSPPLLILLLVYKLSTTTCSLDKCRQPIYDSEHTAALDEFSQRASGHANQAPH